MVLLESRMLVDGMGWGGGGQDGMGWKLELEAREAEDVSGEMVC